MYATKRKHCTTLLFVRLIVYGKSIAMHITSIYIQQLKFFEGISSSFDLLQAQNQLYSRQNNYVQSMLNVIAKKAKLENALNIPIK